MRELITYFSPLSIGSTVAVKFIFLSFIGENVPMMKKAKTSTLKGTITEAFEPFHAELLNASTLDEVMGGWGGGVRGEIASASPFTSPFTSPSPSPASLTRSPP